MIIINPNGKIRLNNKYERYIIRKDTKHVLNNTLGKFLLAIKRSSSLSAGCMDDLQKNVLIAFIKSIPSNNEIFVL